MADRGAYDVSRDWFHQHRQEISAASSTHLLTLSSRVYSQQSICSSSVI